MATSAHADRDNPGSLPVAWLPLRPPATHPRLTVRPAPSTGTWPRPEPVRVLPVVARGPREAAPGQTAERIGVQCAMSDRPFTWTVPAQGRRFAAPDAGFTWNLGFGTQCVIHSIRNTLDVGNVGALGRVCSSPLLGVGWLRVLTPAQAGAGPIPPHLSSIASSCFFWFGTLIAIRLDLVS